MARKTLTAGQIIDKLREAKDFPLRHWKAGRIVDPSSTAVYNLAAILTGQVTTMGEDYGTDTGNTFWSRRENIAVESQNMDRPLNH